MYLHRKQLLIISIATLILAIFFMISTIVSFVPLLAFLIIFLIALSLLTEGATLYLHFRPQEGLMQFIRGLLLLCLFIILCVHFILKRF